MAKNKMHPNSLANLKPWKPGDIPNPTGKSGIHLIPLLEKMLNREYAGKDPISGKKSKKRIAEWLVLKLIANGLDGKEKSLDMILDRIDGAVQKNITIDTSESDSINNLKKQMRDYLKDCNDDGEG